MPQNLPLLSVSDLQVVLEGSVLFEGLSFDLHEGERLVIVGPNGAGKSVLLKALLGIIPCKGNVLWREGVTRGYVPQRVPLHKDLPITVTDFFALKGIPRDKARSILESVGIVDSEFLRTQLGVLSFGQFQRVLIAWAAANRPEVLLLDEAMAGVDVSGEDAIHSFLHRQSANQKTSIILVTHDLSMVYGEATRVLCMNRGRFYLTKSAEVVDPKILQDIYGREIKFLRHDHG